jgi:TPP-dependent pyruvate/acetoin dehydrogenase alpha subunit
VARARRGAGPFFLECTTYRWREHVGPLWDYDKGYRTKAEVDSWIARCPIRRASERLLSEGVCTPERIDAMVRASQLEVDEAVAAARVAPFPAVEDLTLGTY